MILDEATSALDSANEAALDTRMRERACTLISIAHGAALLSFHTKVLELKGGGAWGLHAAESYRFEG